MNAINIANAGKEFDKIIATFDKMEKEADKVNSKFLKLGAEILRQEVIRNINSKLNKTARTNPKALQRSRDKWGKAVDKIKLGSVRTSKAGGKFIVTGILRGDNTDQFYLKFAEYGSAKQTATPIFRPAMIAKEQEIEQLYYKMVTEAVEKVWQGG